MSRFRISQHESEMNSLRNHKNSCQSENLTFAESVSTVQTTDRMVQGYNYRSNCLRISVNYTTIAFSGIRFELRYDTNQGSTHQSRSVLRTAPHQQKNEIEGPHSTRTDFFLSRTVLHQDQRNPKNFAPTRTERFAQRTVRGFLMRI